jgi:BlaI family penicillinase repressor
MRLSDPELDVMTLFWREGELSAPDIFERLGGDRRATYSSTKTIVDRLEKKGAIKRRESRGRTILYTAAVTRDRIRRPLVRAFIRRVFGDDLRPLFAQLVRDEPLSDEELAYLRKLVRDESDARK